jgi:hypothetical protein
MRNGGGGGGSGISRSRYIIGFLWERKRLGLLYSENIIYSIVSGIGPHLLWGWE